MIDKSSDCCDACHKRQFADKVIGELQAHTALLTEIRDLLKGSKPKIVGIGVDENPPTPRKK